MFKKKKIIILNASRKPPNILHKYSCRRVIVKANVLTVQLNENGNARFPPAAPRLTLSEDESDAAAASLPSVNEFPPSTGLVTLPNEQW